MNECPVCGSDAMVEVTSLGDACPSFVCTDGGHYVRPERKAPVMSLVPYGPPVPTPEDILIGAGIDTASVFRG